MSGQTPRGSWPTWGRSPGTGSRSPAAERTLDWRSYTARSPRSHGPARSRTRELGRRDVSAPETTATKKSQSKNTSITGYMKCWRSWREKKWEIHLLWFCPIIRFIYDKYAARVFSLCHFPLYYTQDQTYQTELLPTQLKETTRGVAQSFFRPVSSCLGGELLWNHFSKKEILQKTMSFSIRNRTVILKLLQT